MKSVKLSASLWVSLAIVAGARVAKANEFRTPAQDRGAHRNRINDLTGCIGEFAAIAAASEHGASIQHEFFDASGPVKRPDFYANGIGFDAKALLLDASRRYFILDRKAVQLAASKSIIAFVPVIARMFGDRALVGSRITLSDAMKWPLKDFGYGETYALPLDELGAKYFAMNTHQLLRATGLDIFGAAGADLMESAFVHGSNLRHAGVNAIVQKVGIVDALLMLADDYAKRRIHE